MSRATVEAASAEQVSELAAFVPSRYRERLRRGELAPELRLVGAWADDEPIGAGLAHISEEWANCESLYVLAGRRRDGIGRELLRALEHECRLAGATTMTAVLPDDDRFLAIRRLLGTDGWAAPRLQHRQFETDERIRASAPLNEPHDLSAYRITAFSELDERDRAALRRIARAIPAGLDPLRSEDRVVPEASLLLRRDGEVVGWAVNEYFAPGTTLVATVWIAPSERGGGLGGLLGLLAMRAALDAGYERIRFVVDADNAAMIRIVERVVVPYGATEVGLLETTRSLRVGP